jgi:hypothetical protein
MMAQRTKREVSIMREFGRFHGCPRMFLLCLMGIVLLVPRPAFADLSEGLLAYWSFDNGDATDDSDHGHNGAIHGDPEFVDGVKGKAVRFDGVDDWIEVPGKDFARPVITTSVWLYKEEGVKGVVLIKSDRINSNGLNYGTEFDRRTQLASCVTVRTEDRRTDNDYWISYDFKDERVDGWVHVVHVLTENDYELYANGQRRSMARTPRDFVPYMGDAPLQIGGEHLCDKRSTEFFNSILDEIRIYDRALSADEIRQLYRQCSSPPTVGPEGIIW